MFSYLKGKITIICAKYIVLENNGIGYIVHTPNPFMYKVGNEETIYTHVYIREDIFDIYGFKTSEERDVFIRLLSVKGIGPKGALAILASGDIVGLEQAISSGNAKYLQKYPGIGPKASGQIILDLKGKLSVENKIIEDPKIISVKEALKSLGYNNNEVKKLDQFLQDNIDLPIEQLVKMSLKRM